MENPKENIPRSMWKRERKYIHEIRKKHKYFTRSNSLQTSPHEERDPSKNIGRKHGYKKLEGTENTI